MAVVEVTGDTLPTSPYERAVPAEQGLRAGQQGAPCRSRQAPADGGEEDAIGWSPAGTGNLAFEHAELVAESEDLGAESGVRAAADDQELEQETDGGVGEGAEHNPGASQSPGWAHVGRSSRAARADAAGVNGTRASPRL